jgi:uncharacterized protein (DUF427 family)
MKTTEISCLCDAIKVEIKGEPVEQFYCHCDDCQAVSGGAYVSVAVFPSNAVTVTQGTPVKWKYKVMRRLLCPHCGTQLMAEVPGFDQIGVKANLLPKGMFKPKFHINCRYPSFRSRTSCRTTKPFQPNLEDPMKPSTGNPAPGYKKHPDHRITTKPAGVRVQVKFNGEVIADTRDAIQMEEPVAGSTVSPIVYYFPRKDVKMDRLVRTSHSTYCPFKGHASYFSLKGGPENAVWSYEQPYDEMDAIRERLAFYPDKVDSINAA